MTVVLSERNLLTLLHKLADGRTPCIRKPCGTLVVAELDGVHYANKKAGKIGDDLKDFIIEYETFLAFRAKQCDT